MRSEDGGLLLQLQETAEGLEILYMWPWDPKSGFGVVVRGFQRNGGDIFLKNPIGISDIKIFCISYGENRLRLNCEGCDK